MLAVSVGSTIVQAHDNGNGPGHNDKKPIVIKRQGAYAYGGTTAGDPNTSSIHCDHGFAEYQIPDKPRKIPILMWHSASTGTWEETFDGREGFQSIFLRKGYPVYLVDGPRIGRANWGCEAYTYTPDLGRDQAQISTWRLGSWTPPGPIKFFPGVQFPTKDKAALDQLFRGRYLEFETPVSSQRDTTETAKLINSIGPTTVFTHSGSGIRGWLARLKSKNVAAVVAFEASGFVYPEGETAPSPGTNDITVPLATFKELTKVPLLLIYGDNLDAVPSWADSFRRAKIFVDLVNKYRSPQDRKVKAQLLHLPDIGIRGNTHFAMADLNSDKISDLVSKYLELNDLDGYDKGPRVADNH